MPYNCKMFWCVPSISDSNNIEWDVVSFDSNNDDLSNWMIVLHMMKKGIGANFESCKDSHNGLPRGILIDNILYHGNNMPASIDMPYIAKKLGYSIKNITPCFDKKYTINKDDLNKIETSIGRKLDLEYTD